MFIISRHWGLSWQRLGDTIGAALARGDMSMLAKGPPAAALANSKSRKKNILDDRDLTPNGNILLIFMTETREQK